MIARVLGIDVGTSGVRAAILAADGDIVGIASVSLHSTGDDPSAPETWWRAACACLARLRVDCDLSGILAVAVDGTSGSMVAVDGHGAPVGAVRMYDDPCEDDSILARIEIEAPSDSAALGRTSGLAR